MVWIYKPQGLLLEVSPFLFQPQRSAGLEGMGVEEFYYAFFSAKYSKVAGHGNHY